MTIIFVRSEEGGEAYRDAVRNQPVIFCPVQDIEYIATDVPEEYQVILVTSRQGVKALAKISADRATPIICVGEQTGEAAAIENYETIHIGEGAASNLPGLLEKICPDKTPPVFYARGEEIAFDMEAPLQKRGFNLIQRVVYCARPRENLPEETISALQAGTVGAVIFFSAGTASLFVNMCEKAGVSGALAQTKALCLGGGMIESDKELPFAAVIPAAQPSRAALIALIKEHLS